ncbi:GNAT family N-acetyltransferase [Brachybacterium sp. JHP9]|uniref:GNAT family N-acetyltransferase n=1 Tax=Brachybacterium equifaecis TaxID=2910770 RepID=A0ABT0R212_9MICO|nr:GNAT family N-acetyltransferase [Brachybacterium equifaecis]
MKHDLRLQRGAIVLRPLAREDASAFRALVDEESWAGMSVPLPATDEAMAEHLGTLIEAPAQLAFAVEQDGRLVGRTTLYDLVPGLKVEIGHTIYAREAWGSAVNPTCKLLLLDHAFGELGVGRVALRCDHRNARSRAAILKLGATFEGTLRRFRRAADGTVADADYFSILESEWPGVRDGLEARLRASAQA